MQGVTRRHQTPTWQDPPQSTAGTRKPILTGTLMARTCSIAELRQEFEVLHVGEDAIVRREGNLKPDRCRSHPAERYLVTGPSS